jgi:prepilin-type N-terminal cleavage/methylation domain-containing protein
MKWCVPGNIFKNQRGFTLIELLVAVAIGGSIAAAGSMATRQVILETSRNSNHEIAVRQVQYAGHWLTRDAQMAQSVLPTEDADGLPLTLTWEDWDDDPADLIPPDEYQVVYQIAYINEDGVTIKKLRRDHYTNGALDSTIYVAKYMDTDPLQTSCSFSDPVLTFTITANVGGGLTQMSETRTYEITHRAAADSS